MRRVLFDNARIAVKEGAGKNAIPQESYAALAAHYCFQTDFCNAASGNEKGLVENLVGWTRRNLLVPVPRVASLAELNQRLRDGCESYIAAHQVAGKPHPVAHLLQEERQALLPLPGIPTTSVEPRSAAYPCRQPSASKAMRIPYLYNMRGRKRP